LSRCHKEDYAGNGVISCHDVIRRTMLVMGWFLLRSYMEDYDGNGVIAIEW